jgi:hypothetical protein
MSFYKIACYYIYFVSIELELIQNVGNKNGMKWIKYSSFPSPHLIAKLVLPVILKIKYTSYTSLSDYLYFII